MQADQNLRSRQAMLRRVVVSGWGILGILVLMLDFLMTKNLTLGIVVGVITLGINVVNTFRVTVFIRQSYQEASKNDALLRALDLPIRTVPVVLTVGSVGLVLYLSYALIALATLAKYSFGDTIAKPLIAFAALQLAILAPLYFLMDKKLMKIKNN